MEYFVISAKFVPLKYYTLSSQLRRLTSFSVGLFGSANSVTRSYPVMRKSCISQGLRASSLQFTSPLEFNAIFRYGFPLRVDLNGWSKIRDPVTAKFKHARLL